MHVNDQIVIGNGIDFRAWELAIDKNTLRVQNILVYTSQQASKSHTIKRITNYLKKKQKTKKETMLIVNLLFNSEGINVTVGNGPVEESIRVLRSNESEFQKKQNGAEEGT